MLRKSVMCETFINVLDQEVVGQITDEIEVIPLLLSSQPRSDLG